MMEWKECNGRNILTNNKNMEGGPIVSGTYDAFSLSFNDM